MAAYWAMAASLPLCSSSHKASARACQRCRSASSACGKRICSADQPTAAWYCSTAQPGYSCTSAVRACSAPVRSPESARCTTLSRCSAASASVMAGGKLQQLVHPAAQRPRQRAEQRDIGVGAVGLPFAHGRGADPQAGGQLLLRQAAGAAAGGNVGADLQSCWHHQTFLAFVVWSGRLAFIVPRPLPRRKRGVFKCRAQKPERQEKSPGRFGGPGSACRETRHAAKGATAAHGCA